MNDALKGNFTDFPIKLLLFKPDATKKQKPSLAGERRGRPTLLSYWLCVVKFPGGKQVNN